METRPVNTFIGDTMQKVREMIDANTIIGSPIDAEPGLTIIPVSKVSFGFAGGGSDFKAKNTKESAAPSFGAGTGTGVKIEPVCFIVIKDGAVRVINIAPPASTTVDRLIESIPDYIEKIESLINKNKD